MEQRWSTLGGEMSDKVMVQSDEEGMWSGSGPDGVEESLVERSGMEDITQLWENH